MNYEELVARANAVHARTAQERFSWLVVPTATLPGWLAFLGLLGALEGQQKGEDEGT